MIHRMVRDLIYCTLIGLVVFAILTASGHAGKPTSGQPSWALQFDSFAGPNTDVPAWAWAEFTIQKVRPPYKAFNISLRVQCDQRPPLDRYAYISDPARSQLLADDYWIAATSCKAWISTDWTAPEHVDSNVVTFTP